MDIDFAPRTLASIAGQIGTIRSAAGNHLRQSILLGIIVAYMEAQTERNGQNVHGPWEGTLI